MEEEYSESDKKIRNFIVKDKIFQFNLDKDTCYKKSNGMCPVYKPNIDKIGNQYLRTYVGDKNHCTNIANNIIRNGFDDNLFKIFIIKHKCGHYSITNGQHRICLASKLGLPITVYTKHDNEDECFVCSMSKRDLKFKMKNLIGKNRYYLEKM